MVLRKTQPILTLSLLLTVVAVACGGATTPVPEQGPSGVARRAAVAFAAADATRPGSDVRRVDVFLAVTDERGHTSSHPLGNFEGDCRTVPANRENQSIAAMQCWQTGRGFLLEAIADRGEVLVVSLPLAEGIPPDPMAREEVTRVRVEPGAAIVGAGS